MINLLRSRRSIRKFELRPIESDKVEVLKEALLRAPTSRNLKPCRFIFVDDREILMELSRCKPHGAAFLAGAALGIVILGDSTVSDVWIEDCAIAGILVQMAAQSLGLGSCWIQVRLREHNGKKPSEHLVRDCFDLPDHLRVDSIIGLGYTAEHKPGWKHDSLAWSEIGWNRLNKWQ